jgi:hypothetical protein
MFGNFVDRIYHIELEIKDITDRDRSASYLDHTPYAGAAGMLLLINGKFTMRKLKSSLWSKYFVLNRPSLSISRGRSRYEVDLSARDCGS